MKIAANKPVLLVGLVILFILVLAFIQAVRYSALSSSLILEWAIVIGTFCFLLFLGSLGWKRVSKSRPGRLHSSPLEEVLSTRELEILHLMVEGLTNKEIGNTLHISESTVKKHSGKIFEKLKVKSRTQAIKVANQYKSIL